jgi:hypothetical protein
MSAPHKLHRAERTHALRAPTTLYRRPASKSAKSPRGSVLRSTEDVVLEAVKLGYKIADEQILRGQDFARRLRGASLRAEGKDVGDLVDHGLRLARQLGVLLVEVSETTFQAPAIARSWAKAINEGPAQDKGRHPAPSPAPPHKPTPSPRALPIEVKSTRPTLVSLVLYEDLKSKPVVHYLYRKEDPKAPPLQGVHFKELGPGKGYALVVSVPPQHDQPHGTYFGYAHRESDSAPVGTIEVQITEEP